MLEVAFERAETAPGWRYVVVRFAGAGVEHPWPGCNSGGEELTVFPDAPDASIIQRGLDGSVAAGVRVGFESA